MMTHCFFFYLFFVFLILFFFPLLCCSSPPFPAFQLPVTRRRASSSTPPGGGLRFGRTRPRHRAVQCSLGPLVVPQDEPVQVAEPVYETPVVVDPSMPFDDPQSYPLRTKVQLIEILRTRDTSIETLTWQLSEEAPFSDTRLATVVATRPPPPYDEVAAAVAHSLGASGSSDAFDGPLRRTDAGRPVQSGMSPHHADSSAMWQGQPGSPGATGGSSGTTTADIDPDQVSPQVDVLPMPHSLRAFRASQDMYHVTWAFDAPGGPAGPRSASVGYGDTLIGGSPSVQNPPGSPFRFALALRMPHTGEWYKLPCAVTRHGFGVRWLGTTAGVYSFRVRAIGDAGVASPWSEIAELEIGLDRTRSLSPATTSQVTASPPQQQQQQQQQQQHQHQQQQQQQQHLLQRSVSPVPQELPTLGTPVASGKIATNRGRTPPSAQQSQSSLRRASATAIPQNVPAESTGGRRLSGIPRWTPGSGREKHAGGHMLEYSLNDDIHSAVVRALASPDAGTTGANRSRHRSGVRRSSSVGATASRYSVRSPAPHGPVQPATSDRVEGAAGNRHTRSRSRSASCSRSLTPSRSRSRSPMPNGQTLSPPPPRPGWRPPNGSPPSLDGMDVIGHAVGTKMGKSRGRRQTPK
jgi:hypothetical protein